ncbi:hypothetical protein PGT21_009686 [Puccinia graminis f. sp. tritici]|uniref:Uncharacterized protein n=1 Tax=Puccinia graminis f. sp. tritici TaxID=56615 RepID=A0A5B0LPC2_PUCGR|nr:hypothetical protein PGT21_009686 [Puccinia graminis f. sp. tritici]
MITSASCVRWKVGVGLCFSSRFFSLNNINASRLKTRTSSRSRSQEASRLNIIEHTSSTVQEEDQNIHIKELLFFIGSSPLLTHQIIVDLFSLYKFCCLRFFHYYYWLF